MRLPPALSARRLFSGSRGERFADGSSRATQRWFRGVHWRSAHRADSCAPIATPVGIADGEPFGNILLFVVVFTVYGDLPA